MTTFDQELTGPYVAADNGSLAELVDAAEEHLEHIANDVSQRSVMASPTTGGDTT